MGGGAHIHDNTVFRQFVGLAYVFRSVLHLTIAVFVICPVFSGMQFTWNDNTNSISRRTIAKPKAQNIICVVWLCVLVILVNRRTERCRVVYTYSQQNGGRSLTKRGKWIHDVHFSTRYSHSNKPTFFSSEKEQVNRIGVKETGGQKEITRQRGSSHQWNH